MSSVRIDRPETSAYRPGDTLDVSVSWDLSEAPKALEARLIWFTQGRGTQDVQVVEAQPAPPNLRDRQRFRFRLPDGPYSFSGKLITLAWAVEFVADDVADRWEFVMAPDAKEIQLGQPAGKFVLPTAESRATSRR